MLTLFTFRRIYTLCVGMMKNQFLKFYLEVVEGARIACFSFILTMALLFLGVFGFVLLHIVFFWFVPIDMDTKMIVLSILGSIYFLVPIIVVIWMHSQTRWLKMAGAEKLIETVLQK